MKIKIFVQIAIRALKNDNILLKNLRIIPKEIEIVIPPGKH